MSASNTYPARSQPLRTKRRLQAAGERSRHRPIISSAMVAAIGTGDAFSKGRDFAACWASCPQISTGDPPPRKIWRGNRSARSIRASSVGRAIKPQS